MGQMSDPRVGEATSPDVGEAPLSYDDALRQVMGLADFERSATVGPGYGKFHLERMGLLMERLGNPHLGPPVVHIAGTNGKGSTAAMMTSALTAAGYTTGLYTSPHLHSAVERIRVGLTPIARGEFAALVRQAWPVAEWAGANGAFGLPTFFEMLTAMAFLHFRNVGVDVSVIEVGLGGRLDATNVVSPTVCVITPVSLDHVATLGDTVALIAAEKAGIIKSGVPVVVAPQCQEATDVVAKVAAEKGAPLVDVARRFSWRISASSPGGQSLEIDGPVGRYDLCSPLLGDHQVENVATSIAALETLDRSGVAIPRESIVVGLGSVDWPGRVQVLSNSSPLVVVDGAHNPDAMRRLVETVRARFQFDRVILIFGGLSGHSAQGMLREVSQLSPTIMAARSRHPRSAPSSAVASTARQIGLEVASVSDDVGVATRQALDVAGGGDLVLGTGSLSVAAEVIEELEGTPTEVYPYIKGPINSSLSV